MNWHLARMAGSWPRQAGSTNLLRYGNFLPMQNDDPTDQLY